jgi:ABC-type nitrate/sulfonate/bicarbonate transport system substrate-binding protein
MHNKFNMGWLVVPFTLLCWISLASAQSTKLAVGYSGISADQLVIWVAKDTGIFAKNNIDAQTIYFSPAARFP